MKDKLGRLRFCLCLVHHKLAGAAPVVVIVFLVSSVVLHSAPSHSQSVIKRDTQLFGMLLNVQESRVMLDKDGNVA